MQLRCFWIPALDPTTAEAEVNRFLGSHRVLHVDRAFSAVPGAVGWAVCVQWQPAETAPAGGARRSAGRVDYREELDPESFRWFSALRTWRKGVAQAQAVPIYTVATNEQLAAIARGRLATRTALEQVEGFGASRLEKHAEEIVALCQRLQQTTSTDPVRDAAKDAGQAQP